MSNTNIIVEQFSSIDQKNGQLGENQSLNVTVSSAAVYIVNNIKYRVLDSKNVSVVGSTNVKIKKLYIGSKVTIDGKKYQITKIEAKAFKGYKNLKKVIIGNNIVVIGHHAFQNDKQLSSIVIRSSKLTTIGNHAWLKISKHAKFYIPKAAIKRYKKLMKKKTGYKNTMKMKS